jgi:hypothetical protein
MYVPVHIGNRKGASFMTPLTYSNNFSSKGVKYCRQLSAISRQLKHKSSPLIAES